MVASRDENWFGVELSSGRYAIVEELGEGGMGRVY